jgi:hypothetical protein
MPAAHRRELFLCQTRLRSQLPDNLTEDALKVGGAHPLQADRLQTIALQHMF